MYNEEQKNRYINMRENEVVVNKFTLRSYFERSEVLEKKLDKDVCNFSVYDIYELYKILNMSSLSSLSMLNSNYSMYTQWCLQEGLVSDSQNHFLEITRENLSKCINKSLIQKKLVSREQILDWTSHSLLNPRDQFIILSLFEFGKSKNFCDIYNAKIEDIDGNYMKLYSGRIVRISDELKNFAYNATEAKLYYTLNERNPSKLVNNGTIIKEYHNARSDSEYYRGRRIYNSIVRSFDMLGVKDYMTANDIVESGQINMIMQESKKLGMTFKDYCMSTHVKDVIEQYGIGTSMYGYRNRILRKYGDLI